MLRLARTGPARLVGRLLAAGFVIFLAVRLAQEWRRESVDLSGIDPGLAVAAVVVSAAAVTSYGVVWLLVLRRLGVDAPVRRLALFFKSQLGKYIPGSVWQYAGRVGLGKGYGVAAGVGIAAIGVEVVASAAAAGSMGLLVLRWLAVPALVAVVFACLAAAAVVRRTSGLAARVVRRLGVDAGVARSAVRALSPAALLYVGVWVVYGAAFWLTARALFAVPASDLALYIGTFALAWLAGFVAVFAPGGVGVREAVIVALLSSRLGEANAIVLAAASRIVLTAVDLAGGGLSLVLPAGGGSARRRAEARG